MGVFDFLKKNDSATPPDVGKESQALGEQPVEPGTGASGEEAAFDPGELPPTPDEGPVEDDELPKGKKGKKGKVAKEGKADPMLNLKMERMDARLESLNTVIKGFGERFTNISQQMGELRGMSLANEKTVSKLAAESAKAIDVVNAVKPEKVRFDYQKLEGRVDQLSGKIDSNKEYLNSLLEEMKELRRKADSFIGAEGLVQMQQDVKKDLINIQQINAKAKMHADKAEQLFIETQKMSSEYNQVIETLNNFEANYSALKKEFEKIKLDFTNIATKGELAEMKKRVESKISLVDNAVSYIEKMKDDNDRILRLVENTVALSKKNEQDILELALGVGNDHIGKAGEYDDKLKSLLTIIDTLAGQVSDIKKRVGMNVEKMRVPTVQPKRPGLVLKNIEVNAQMSQNFSSPQQQSQPQPQPQPKDQSQPQPQPKDQPQDVKDESKAVEPQKTDVKPDEIDSKQSEVKPAEISVEQNEVKNTTNELKPIPDAISGPQKEETAPQIQTSASVENIILPQSDKIQAPPEILSIIEAGSQEEIAATPMVQDVPNEQHEIKHRRHRRPKLHRKIDDLDISELDSIDESTENQNDDSIYLASNLPPEEILMRLRQQIAEGMAIVDRANKRELEKKYLSMKSLYDSLPKKDSKIYKQIIEFYDKMNNKFYTSVFN